MLRHNKARGRRGGGMGTEKTVKEFPDGTRYEGEYRNGKRHGQGILTMPDGTRYEGAFRDGKPVDDGDDSDTDGSH